MKIIKLNFNSPLHIGEIGLGLEECSPIIRSDTIFNSIINAHSLMHSKEETDDFVKEFNTIKISSAFPFCGNEIYFPKPKKMNMDEELHSDHSTNLKTTEFISQEYFEKIINFKELNENEVIRTFGGVDFGFVHPATAITIKKTIKSPSIAARAFNELRFNNLASITLNYETRLPPL